MEDYAETITAERVKRVIKGRKQKRIQDLVRKLKEARDKTRKPDNSREKGSLKRLKGLKVKT